MTFTKINLVLFTTAILFAGAVSISVESVYGSHHEYSSPRQQMANGVAAEDVICKTGMELMIRSNGNAICVTPSTATKLSNDGWDGAMIKEAKSVYDPKEHKDHSIKVSAHNVDEEYPAQLDVFIHKFELDKMSAKEALEGIIETHNAYQDAGIKSEIISGVDY